MSTPTAVSSEELRSEFEQTLRLDSRSAWAEYMLGKLAWLDGDLPHSLTYLQRAAELGPGSDATWYGLGICYTQLRRYPEAIDAFKKALAHREADAQYHTALGEVLVYRGDTITNTRFESTQVLDVYPYRVVKWEPNVGP